MCDGFWFINQVVLYSTSVHRVCNHNVCVLHFWLSSLFCALFRQCIVCIPHRTDYIRILQILEIASIWYIFDLIGIIWNEKTLFWIFFNFSDWKLPVEIRSLKFSLNLFAKDSKLRRLFNQAISLKHLQKFFLFLSLIWTKVDYWRGIKEDFYVFQFE